MNLSKLVEPEILRGDSRRILVIYDGEYVKSLNFLALNNFDFDASNSDVVETILGLANNEIDEEMLVHWFRVNSSEILSPET